MMRCAVGSRSNRWQRTPANQILIVARKIFYWTALQSPVSLWRQVAGGTVNCVGATTPRSRKQSCHANNRNNLALLDSNRARVHFDRGDYLCLLSASTKSHNHRFRISDRGGAAVVVRQLCFICHSFGAGGSVSRFLLHTAPVLF